MRCATTAGAVLGAAVEALFQRVQGRRQDEDANHVGPHCLGKLLAPLPVDVEDDVAAGVQRALHRVAGGAVPVAEHLGALEEFPALPQTREGGLVDEVVVAAVDLVRPLRPRGVGDRDFDVAAFALDQAAGDGGLARA